MAMRIERRGIRALRLHRLWTTDLARAIDAGCGPGTICPGPSTGDAGLRAAPRRVSASAGFAPSGSSSPMPKARVTRGLRQQIGVDCQSMPTSHAAVRHGVSWSKARRAEKAFLAEWDRHAAEATAAPHRAR